jgi:hypothetical protein
VFLGNRVGDEGGGARGRGNTCAPIATNERLRGIDAMTGRSYFDISEWDVAPGAGVDERARVNVAMLCENSVARQAAAARVVGKRDAGRRRRGSTGRRNRNHFERASSRVMCP